MFVTFSKKKNVKKKKKKRKTNSKFSNPIYVALSEIYAYDSSLY